MSLRISLHSSFTVTKLRINKLKSLGTNYIEGRSFLLIPRKGYRIPLTNVGVYNNPSQQFANQQRDICLINWKSYRNKFILYS